MEKYSFTVGKTRENKGKPCRSEGVVAERRIFFLHALQGWSGREPRFLRTSVRPCRGPPASRPPVPQKHQNMCKRSKPFKINGLRPFWGAHLRAFVYEHLRKHAPMQRSVHFDICPFGTRACHMGSKKRSKQFKINGLGCFGEACFEVGVAIKQVLPFLL